MTPAQPIRAPKVTLIRLTTRATNDGDQCVRRNPSKIRTTRDQVDIVRLQNDNNPGSGNNITVIVDAARAGDIFFPPPASRITLAPQEHVDWTVQAPGIINYRTDPANCDGADQADIEIRC